MRPTDSEASPDSDASHPRRPKRKWVGLAAYAFFQLAIALLFLQDALPPGKVLAPADALLSIEPWHSSTNGERPPPSNPLLGDVNRQFLPWSLFAAKEVRSGRLPLWNPYGYCGSPLLANPQSALLSIYTLPYYLAPLSRAPLLAAILKLLVAGCGGFVCLSRFGLGWLPCALGATGTSLSGFMVVWLGYPHSAAASWLPWVVWAYDRMRAERTCRSLARAAVFTALLNLSGHPETAFHSLLAAAVFVMVVALAGRKGGEPSPFLGLPWITGAVVLGTLLSSVQILPFAEYISQSRVYAERAAAPDPIAAALHTFSNRASGEGSSGPADLIASYLMLVPSLLLFPYSFGSPVAGREYYGAPCNFNECGGAFVGVLAIGLAVLGLVGLRRERPVQGLAAVLALSLGAVLPIPPVYPILWRLPVARLVHHHRLRFVVAFALAAAAAFGLRRAGLVLERRDRRGLRALVLAGCVLGLAIMVIACATPRLCVAFQCGGHVPDLERYLWRALGHIGLGALVLAGGAAASWWRRSRRPFQATALVLVLAELFSFGRGYNPAIPAKDFYPPTETTTWLASRPRPFRVLPVGRTLPGNTSTVYGIEDIRGYDAIEVARYVSLFETAGFPLKEGNEPLLALDYRPSPLLDMLNVRYVLADHPLLDPRLEEAARFGGLLVYENRRALPRAIVVPRFRVASAEVQASLLSDPAWDPASDVLLESDPAIDPRDGAAVPARITDWSPNRVVVQAGSKDGGILLLSDAFYPGWKARVDGMPAPVLRAHTALRAVPLGPGDHVVEFRFEPLSVTLGALLTLATAFGLALATLSARPSGRSGDRDPPAKSRWRPTTRGGAGSQTRREAQPPEVIACERGASVTGGRTT